MATWVKFKSKMPDRQTIWSIEGDGSLINLDEERKAAAMIGFTEVVNMEVICKD